MTDREKMIELLSGDMCKSCCCYDCEYETDEKGCIEEIRRKMADHLIANGVEVPVRCYECRFEGTEDCPMVHRDSIFGGLWSGQNSTGYCNHGERKGNDCNT